MKSSLIKTVFLFPVKLRKHLLEQTKIQM